jgi:hypothetical protein
VEVDVPGPERGSGACEGGDVADPGDDEVPPLVAIEIYGNQPAGAVERFRQADVDHFRRHLGVG